MVEKYLHRLVSPQMDRFAALHAAIWSGGHFLYVPRGVVVDKPFRVAAGLTDGATDSGHTLIVIEEGAEATFLYESNSAASTSGGLHCGAVEVVVRPGANLRYVNLQDWGRKVWHFAHQRAVVQRDANLQWTVAALGSVSLKSARGCTHRRRSNITSQWCDVHSRKATAHLQHSSAPQSQQLPKRLSLQGRSAGSITHGLARHDQGRCRSSTNRWLSTQ